jgi:hypothetical protein
MHTRDRPFRSGGRSSTAKGSAAGPPLLSVSSDAKVSAILLSWRRVENLNRIIADLRRWKRVTEIIVWNNNCDRTLSYPNVTVINAPRNFGSLVRYCIVPLAINDTIWFQDDDIFVKETQFETVFKAYLSNASRIYGCRGRNLTKGIYAMVDAFGECDIIVSQTMMFHRSLLYHLFQLIGRIQIGWAADDIAFSLSCPTRHIAVDVGPLEEFGWDDENAQWRMPGWLEIRQRQVDMMLPFRNEIDLDRRGSLARQCKTKKSR